MRRAAFLLGGAILFCLAGCGAENAAGQHYTLEGRTSASVSSAAVSSTESGVISAEPDPQVALAPETADGFAPMDYVNQPEASRFALPEGCRDFSVKDGMLYDASGQVLLRCPLAREGEVVVPDGVREIGLQAFAGCRKITAVRLPDTLESIGALAFCQCEGLKRVNLPRSVESMGLSVFLQCGGLETVRVEGRSEAPDTWPRGWFDADRQALLFAPQTGD